MKLALTAASILLAGCAISSSNIDDLDTTGRDPACVRQCTATYSDCIGQSTRALGRLNQQEAMAACRSGAKVCVSTCQRK